MTAQVLVTGGTGRLGRRLVPRLHAAGLELRVLSRRPQPVPDAAENVVGDLVKDEGLARAVDGVGTIVHCAGSYKDDAVATRNLVRAAARAHVAHLVFVSVVGADAVRVTGPADRMFFRYFANKLEAERVVSRGAVPWTTLRATQFHDLVLTVVRGMTRLPVVPVPAGFRFQPVETDEVAARLVELALGDPQGLVPDIGGPLVEPMSDLVGAYLRAVRRERRLVPVRVPGGAAAAVRAGAILCPDQAVGKVSWADFLRQHVP
jgi:uncharacterized protein YbjT (DUF2867 family)